MGSHFGSRWLKRAVECIMSLAFVRDYQAAREELMMTRQGSALTSWHKDPYAEVERLGKLVKDFTEDDGARAKSYRQLRKYLNTVISMNEVWDAVKAKSPDDATRLEGWKFEDKQMDLRQQAPGGRVVCSLDETFEAAQQIRRGFGELLKYIERSC